MTRRDLWGWLVHLRLWFQFLLSPVFLWGYLSGGGTLSGTLVLGYLAFHLFGYAGGTAFNSCYDRDTGPIGGLEFPPPIPRGLLPFSLVWQLAGFALALLVNLPFALIYLAMACLSFAYSHPRVRWKGRPLAALFTVAVGQGVLASLAGWVAARGDWLSAISPLGIITMAAATLLTIGLYPLTGIYQIDEDRTRGDQTLPVWLGPAAAFQFSIISLFLGGSMAIALILYRYAALEAALLGLFLLFILWLVWRWRSHFDEADIHGNFHTIMRLYATISLGLMFWIGIHLSGLR